jgi:hypothetical protein
MTDKFIEYQQVEPSKKSFLKLALLAAVVIACVLSYSYLTIYQNMAKLQQQLTELYQQRPVISHDSSSLQAIHVKTEPLLQVLEITSKTNVDNIPKNVPTIVENTKAENIQRSNNANEIRLIIAAANLKAAIYQGKNFSSELNEVRLLTTDGEISKQINIIANYSADAPNLGLVLTEFEKLSASIINPTVLQIEGDNFLDKLKQSLGQLIVVKKIDIVKQQQVLQLLTASKNNLLTGELEKAISGLDSLPIEFKLQASSWQKLVGDLYKLRQASDKILSQLVNQTSNQASK